MKQLQIQVSIWFFTNETGQIGAMTKLDEFLMVKDDFDCFSPENNFTDGKFFS